MTRNVLCGIVLFSVALVAAGCSDDDKPKADVQKPPVDAGVKPDEGVEPTPDEGVEPTPDQAMDQAADQAADGPAATGFGSVCTTEGDPCDDGNGICIKLNPMAPTGFCSKECTAQVDKEANCPGLPADNCTSGQPCYYAPCALEMTTEDDDGGVPDDGGVDEAGAEDAGVDEAGAEDAGVDEAGAEDAGVEDAGVDEAGAEDAGVDEAGAEDAGVDEAGAEDAGVDEAGAEDAGVDEAGAEDAGVEDVGPPPPPPIPPGNYCVFVCKHPETGEDYDCPPGLTCLPGMGICL